MKFKIDKKEESIEERLNLFEYLKENNYSNNFIAALVNGKLEDLNYKISNKDDIHLINRFSNIGKKIYSSSLSMILILAAKKVIGDKKVIVQYSIGDGIYISFEDFEITHEEVKNLEIEMRNIIEKNISITKERVSTAVAKTLFAAEGYQEKIDLIDSLNEDYVDLYLVEGRAFSFDKVLVSNTSFLADFNLVPYHPGLVIIFPNNEEDKNPVFKEQVSISKLHNRSKKWTELMDIEYAGSLNKIILEDKMDKLIQINEAYYNIQLTNCAKKIVNNDMRIVMLAGPSSSGKTTTAKKLAIQLAALGANANVISTDDYFVDRDKTPTNKFGEKEFESLRAIDFKKLDIDLINLLEGEEVELPTFNFLTGKNIKSDRKIKLSKNNVLIVEGIHSLNPKLSPSIPEKDKFKIYVSALSQINIDSHNRISSSDSRLIRRIVRDKNFRGYEAEETLENWDNVRAGEREYIFPYQEHADFYLDTSMLYEFNALKNLAIKNLNTVKKESPYYYKAEDLKSLLDNFLPIDDLSIVSKDSILREFIGYEG